MSSKSGRRNPAFVVDLERHVRRQDVELTDLRVPRAAVAVACFQLEDGASGGSFFDGDIVRCVLPLGSKLVHVDDLDVDLFSESTKKTVLHVTRVNKTHAIEISTLSHFIL